MVGLWVLVPAIGVRIPVREQIHTRPNGVFCICLWADLREPLGFDGTNE